MKMLILVLSVILATANAQQQSNESCIPDPVVSDGPMIPGGIQNAVVDEYALTALGNCNLAWNQKYSSLSSFFKVSCVRRLQTQVVSGVIYYANLTLSETVCPRPSLTSSENQFDQTLETYLNGCTLKSDGKKMNCSFTCWSQPWLNSYQLTKQPNCVNA